MLKLNNKNFLLPENIIEHNYINAITAIAACRELKVSINTQIKALSSFKGVKELILFVRLMELKFSMILLIIQLPLNLPLTQLRTFKGKRF